METYIINCPKCKEETKHLVYKLSRKRGIKLRCGCCGYVKRRYYNLNNLKGGIQTNAN